MTDQNRITQIGSDKDHQKPISNTVTDCKPLYLVNATFRYNELLSSFLMLLSVQPNPVHDIEEVGDELDRARDRLNEAIRSYNSTPKVCGKCGIDLKVDGDDLICPRCGSAYYPEIEFDPIPF